MIKKADYSEEQIKLARYAKALGHPARVLIFEYLINNSHSCCYSGDMIEILPIARSTLSQHLKELKNAGVIKGTIEGNSICYCIDETALQHLNNYIAHISERISKRTTCC